MYKWVVDDVTKTVREEFLNEGVDSQVLEDLKQVGGFEDNQRVLADFYLLFSHSNYCKAYSKLEIESGNQIYM